MKTRNYVVKRDNIYVGEVVRTSSVYRYEGKRDFFGIKSGQLTTDCWTSYRSMLFVPDEHRLSNDLLYRTPSYPILNVTDDNTCLNLGKRSILIKDACNLAELLKYFGYQEDLTYEDIMKIRKTFFTGRFAKDNCQLFGWKEIMAEDVKFYVGDEEVTNPRDLENRRRKFREEQQAGHRMFYGVSESPLPREYWDVLDERGNNTLNDMIVHWAEKMNAFRPPIKEGRIKKLSRF